MSDKPNARELLKEARAELAKAHDHLMELTAKLPMQYFGLVDGNIIQAEDCLISQLDAYLAAPSESAMEMVRKIRKDGIFNDSQPTMKEPVNTFEILDTEAVALIEDYAARETAAPRDLVRRMREAGTWKADSEAWYALCAEADKVLGETTP